MPRFDISTRNYQLSGEYLLLEETNTHLFATNTDLKKKKTFLIREKILGEHGSIRDETN